MAMAGNLWLYNADATWRRNGIRKHRDSIFAYWPSIFCAVSVFFTFHTAIFNGRCGNFRSYDKNKGDLGKPILFFGA